MVVFARRYEILSHLGAGTFGNVFHARDHNQHFDVAIKLYRPGLAPFMAFHEAAALTALGGPNILRVHNADVYQDVPYITTELAIGSAADRLVGGLGVDPMTAVLWVRQLLQGLTVCHEAGILHRDVKPGNLFLRSEEHAQLGDFGCVERMTSGAAPVAGDLRYVAPEGLLTNSISVQADVYSAGLCLWELLTGSLPFGTVTDWHATILAGVNRRVRNLAPHVPAWIARVAEGAVARDPINRYSTANAMHAALGGSRVHEAVWREVLPDGGAVRQWTTVRGIELTTRLSLVGSQHVVETRRANGRRFGAGCFEGGNARRVPIAMRTFFGRFG